MRLAFSKGEGLLGGFACLLHCNQRGVSAVCFHPVPVACDGYAPLFCLLLRKV